MDVPASAMPQLLSRLNTIINTSRDGYECLPFNKFFADESPELKIVSLSKLSAQFHVAVLQELFGLIALHSASTIPQTSQITQTFHLRKLSINSTVRSERSKQTENFLRRESVKKIFCSI